MVVICGRDKFGKSRVPGSRIEWVGGIFFLSKQRGTGNTTVKVSYMVRSPGMGGEMVYELLLGSYWFLLVINYL